MVSRDGLFIDADFWRGKRVFVTGHTGFKGAWLTLWLHSMGAKVFGYALPPATEPSLYTLVGLDEVVTSTGGDIRELEALEQAMQDASPDVVFHLAAQAIVRESYISPVDTYATNLMGTVHLLEAVRHCPTVRAAVLITTDKCYENREWVWGYRESDPMGGFDPYSSSKGCAELAISAYRNSFFSSGTDTSPCAAIASARAGNVIGGGDWAADRLIPDILRSFGAGIPVRIRRPDSVRPWQYVLEPLCGYLRLAQLLYAGDGFRLAQSFNFGPHTEDARDVGWIVRRMVELWGPGASYDIDNGAHPHEANYLRLDVAKAGQLLGWHPVWNIRTALGKTVDWEKRRLAGENVRSLCVSQIEEYQDDLERNRKS